MSKKTKCFGYSNNYLESIISKVLGFSVISMGYSEDNTHYYYWYSEKDKQEIMDKLDLIKNEIQKLEKCNAHVTNYNCEEGQVVLILFFDN